MEQPITYYIALGSNKGDKLKHLQDAVNAIYNRIGHVRVISKVYQSPALGFKGDSFFNCCLILETAMVPQKVLDELLRIETELGRTRTITSGYENRTIDLDVIFANDAIIDTETLAVPHPEMHKRKFVLLPLNDIANSMQHPSLGKTVAELLHACADTSVLEPLNIWLKNPSKQWGFTKYSYIAIEGNIGAGKTSLATIMAQDFNAKLILERFADNAFLPKFYKDPSRYAFPLEMAFLADRYQQISDDLSQLDLFKNLTISDYYVLKSLIFSKITLNEDEFTLHRKLFNLMYRDIKKPDLYLYLYQNTDRLQENIKNRGRDYEQNISDAYLDKINTGYLEFLKTQTDFKASIIDVSERDFVSRREDYLWVLRQISKQMD